MPAAAEQDDVSYNAIAGTTVHVESSGTVLLLPLVLLVVGAFDQAMFEVLFVVF